MRVVGLGLEFPGLLVVAGLEGIEERDWALRRAAA